MINHYFSFYASAWLYFITKTYCLQLLINAIREIITVYIARYRKQDHKQHGKNRTYWYDLTTMLFTHKKIKLGVTGFSRTGKTVFIGSLVQALLTADCWAGRCGQGPLAQFTPFELGQFQCASIRDDVHADLPQFPFRKVRDCLTGKQAVWPEPTEAISHLVLDIDYHHKGRLWDSDATLQLELIDYPGEWLADLPMLAQNYANWSDTLLQRARKGQRAEWSAAYFAALETMTSHHDDEAYLEQLADLWRAYLQQAAANGLVYNQPGRLLRPGEMLHSPVLRLVPLPKSLRKGKLGQKLKSRFAEYHSKVIKPFYSRYFATIDRQIVLVDVLRTLQLGEDAYTELMDALKLVLKAFRYSKGHFYDWLTRHHTTHVLFAATKADHVTRGDRANLERMLRKMIRQIDDDNQFKSSVKHFEMMEIAALKAVEDRMTVKAPKREILFGRPVNANEAAAYDPGVLPLDVPPDWATLVFQFLQFCPPPMPDAFDEGFPAINLGKALNFLLHEDFS